MFGMRIAPICYYLLQIGARFGDRPLISKFVLESGYYAAFANAFTKGTSDLVIAAFGSLRAHPITSF